MMIIGFSVPQMFSTHNLLQVFLHILGCIFTIWFIADTWPPVHMWAIWAPFCVLPFLAEVAIITQAFTFNKDISRNTVGRKR